MEGGVGGSSCRYESQNWGKVQVQGWWVSVHADMGLKTGVQYKDGVGPVGGGRGGGGAAHAGIGLNTGVVCGLREQVITCRGVQRFPWVTEAGFNTKMSE